LKYVDQFTAVAKGEGLYFRYESLLKKLESRLGAVVAATGSIYAVRRELLTEFSPDVANDLAHPIQTAAAGFKVVFEPRAVATERATAEPHEEFARKTRIVTRGMTAFARYWRTGRMLRGTWGLCFISHKLLRWFGWLYAVVAFGATLMLTARGQGYALLLAAQALFYLMALAGWAAGGRRGRLLAVPFYFCMINAAAFRGAIRFLSGRRMAIWESAPTTR
jgi:cellulose synthase/poly-beta-1,6-N-acetylglucosamine synthase-like glycosyltransferase